MKSVRSTTSEDESPTIIPNILATSDDTQMETAYKSIVRDLKLRCPGSSKVTAAPNCDAIPRKCAVVISSSDKELKVLRSSRLSRQLFSLI